MLRIEEMDSGHYLTDGFESVPISEEDKKILDAEEPAGRLKYVLDTLLPKLKNQNHVKWVDILKKWTTDEIWTWTYSD